MASIKILVPDYWPEFAVTSYYRPGDKGAHGKHRAIDITPIWPFVDKDNDSPFWFIYFETANLLWAAMRYGRVYISQPPLCPHFHIDVDPTVAIAGVEQTLKVNGKCKFNRLLLSGNRANYSDFQQFVTRVGQLSKAYRTTWANIRDQYKYGTKSDEKYITVHGGKHISDAELQTKLDAVFGDGSGTQAIADQAAKIAGYMTGSDLTGGLAIAAILGAALFFLAKDETPKR